MNIQGYGAVPGMGMNYGGGLTTGSLRPTIDALIGRGKAASARMNENVASTIGHAQGKTKGRGIGGLLGTIVGGVIGTIVAPGIGTQLGAALGGALGGGVGGAIGGSIGEHRAHSQYLQQFQG